MKTWKVTIRFPGSKRDIIHNFKDLTEAKLEYIFLKKTFIEALIKTARHYKHYIGIYGLSEVIDPNGENLTKAVFSLHGVVKKVVDSPNVIGFPLAILFGMVEDGFFAVAAYPDQFVAILENNEKRLKDIIVAFPDNPDYWEQVYIFLPKK